MGLTYPSPKAFAHSLKLRRDATKDSPVLIVVEGVSDKRAIMPFLNIGVKVVVSTSKDHSLGAYDGMGDLNLDNILFLVDCDGDTSPRYKGRIDLILSSNRDIEADMIFELDALARLANEYLSDACEGPLEVLEKTQKILSYVRDVTSLFGTVIEAARIVGARIRIRDIRNNKMRRIRLLDLMDVKSPCIDGNSIPSVELLVSQIGIPLRWTEEEVDRILIELTRQSSKVCRLHSVSSCLECRARRYSNGHDIVDLLKISLKVHCNVEVSVSDVQRGIRMSSKIEGIDSWKVVKRVRAWEDEIGLPVFG